MEIIYNCSFLAMSFHLQVDSSVKKSIVKLIVTEYSTGVEAGAFEYVEAINIQKRET